MRALRLLDILFAAITGLCPLGDMLAMDAASKLSQRRPDRTYLPRSAYRD